MKSNAHYMLTLAAENLAYILCFAHSMESLGKLRESHEGEWKALDRLFFDIPEKRADRALLEMAFLARAVDDSDGISDHLGEGFGSLATTDGQTTTLSLREVCNKIIHSARYDWQIADSANLTVVCIGEDRDKWVSAEIKINSLATAFGKLGI